VRVTTPLGPADGHRIGTDVVFVPVMRRDADELATVLAALRYWQQDLGDNHSVGSVSPHFEEQRPLSAADHDRLVDRNGWLRGISIWRADRFTPLRQRRGVFFFFLAYLMFGYLDLIFGVIQAILLVAAYRTPATNEP
jgi:hypothetical protein